MQEEFDRFTGYYWLPKSKQTNPKVGYIVYEVVDETGVNEMNFVSLGFPIFFELDFQRYHTIICSPTESINSTYTDGK